MKKDDFQRNGADVKSKRSTTDSTGIFQQGGAHSAIAESVRTGADLFDDDWSYRSFSPAALRW